MTWLSLVVLAVAFAMGQHPPGSTPATVLALCGAGLLGIVVSNGSRLSRGEKIAILAGAGLSTLAATIAAGLSPGAIAPSASRDWLFGVRNALAAWGAAGMMVSLIRVVLDGWSQRRRFATDTRAIETILPSPTTLVALTGAIIAGGIWNLSTQAMIWHATSGDAWLFVLWLLAAAEEIAAAEWSASQLAGWARSALAAIGVLIAVLTLISMPLL